LLESRLSGKDTIDKFGLTKETLSNTWRDLNNAKKEESEM